MAKGIVKRTEKEAKKQLRQEGAFKGLSRKEKKALTKSKASEARNWIRGQMAEAKKVKAIKKTASDAEKREEARRGGKKLAYDVDKTAGRYSGKPSEVMQSIRRTSGSFGSTDNTPTRLSMNEGAANRKAQAAAKPGETYIIVRPDGSKKTVRKKDPNKDYSKAKYGAKVKAVKKAKIGGKIKKEQAKLDARGKKLQSENKPSAKNTMVKPLKVNSSKRGEAVQAKEGIAEKATSGPGLVKWYMSKAGGGMSREQAVAKMVRAKK